MRAQDEAALQEQLFGRALDGAAALGVLVLQPEAQELRRLELHVRRQRPLPAALDGQLGPVTAPAGVSTGNPDPGPIHLYLAPSPTTVLRWPSAVVPVAADVSSCSPPSSWSSKNVRQRPMSSGSRSEPRPNAASLSPPKTPSESSW